LKCFVGIDLGSTTTKAVVLGGDGAILGRGITNSRSNYDLAAKVAREEAFITARFALLRAAVEQAAGKAVLTRLLRAFRLSQTLAQLARLKTLILKEIERSASSPRSSRRSGPASRTRIPPRARTSSATRPAPPTCASPRSVASPTA